MNSIETPFNPFKIKGINPALAKTYVYGDLKISLS